MSKTYIVSKHTSESRLLLAVCDKDINGKKFEDGDSVLDLSSKFYQGEELDEAETAQLMEKAYVINAAGKQAVALIVKLGLAEAENVKKIGGVPHVQVLMI